MPGRILAFGGFSIGTPFDDLALNLAAGTRVLFVPTAAGDPQRMLVAFYESFARRAEPAHRKLLCGWSAGMICWFEAGVTDSFGPELAGMRDGLGILAGSACPHYDGEARRRPVYTSLVQNGFPPGIACDDAAGVLYEGTELVEVVARERGAGAFRVGRDGEHPLDARLL